MSKVGILGVIIRLSGLIALFFSPWWYIGIAGFLLLATIQQKNAPTSNPVILVRNDTIRITTEVILLFVAAWGLSTLPFIAEHERMDVLKITLGAAAFTLLWHPFLILMYIIGGSIRRMARGY